MIDQEFLHCFTFQKPNLPFDINILKVPKLKSADHTNSVPFGIEAVQQRMICSPCD